MWHCWNDGWGRDLGKVMAQDMKHLDKLGLDGMVSCQTQRCFWPHPHAMHAMAEMLWNAGSSASALRQKVFADTYGQAAKLATQYWDTLVKKTGHGNSYAHRDIFTAGQPVPAGLLDNLTAWLDKMQSSLTSVAKSAQHPVHRESLRMLIGHARLTSLLVVARCDALAGRATAVARARKQAQKLIDELTRDFDSWIDPKEMLSQALRHLDEIAREAAGLAPAHA